MRFSLSFLFIAIGFCCCTPNFQKKEVYYINNSDSFFQSMEVNFDTIIYVTYNADKILDVIPEGLNQSNKRGVTYSLHYFLKIGKYKDTTFVKHKSYLDSIEVYGSEWLKNNDNLANFWKRSSGWPDSVKIFLFESIPGTDSLKFRRVHRYYYTPDD